MSAYETVLDALRANGRNVVERGDQAAAQCPAHDDHNPSLSVRRRDDGKGVLLHCHGGCDYRAVLGAVGLTDRDMFDDPQLRNAYQPANTYVYSDGRRVHRKAGKEFRQSGNTKGRALFGADRIGEAALVFVVEGEKDVLAVEGVGGTAVCSAMGAANADKADWSALAGLDVIVVADRDDAGQQYADTVCKLLAGVALSVKVVHAKVGKDAADHIAAGYGLHEFTNSGDRGDDPMPDGLPPDESHADAEPTTWEPVDLGPWLDGTHISPQPSLGLPRSDGQRLIYPGREHSIYGETESGKSWFALGCVAVELRMGRDVLYIHYEEGDPGSTIERLMLLGVPTGDIRNHLRFVAPGRPGRAGWLADLLEPAPALVIHDGVNEAMSLHGDDSMATDGAATFRRNLIKPCLAVGAATLACDHVTKSGDGRGRYAIGAAHKVAAIDGAAFMVENMEPFGRGMRGASSVFVTKDRPGQLRAQGKATGLPGKTFMGVLAVDATGNSPDFLTFWAPKDDEAAEPAATAALPEVVYEVIAAQDNRTVDTSRNLHALMRLAGHSVKYSALADAVADLVVTGRLRQVDGNRGAKGYYAVPSTVSSTVSQPSDEVAPGSVDRDRFHDRFPLRGETVETVNSRTVSPFPETVGNAGKRSLSKSDPEGIRKGDRR